MSVHIEDLAHTHHIAGRLTRLRSSKAAGSFSCTKHGAYELLIHMEADPGVETYREFDFASVVSDASPFEDLSAYQVDHTTGRYVLCVPPDYRPNRFKAAWDLADSALARRQTWLFARDFRTLRIQPRWRNAQLIAKCAHQSFSPTDTARIVEHLATFGKATLRDCMSLCAESDDSLDAVLKLVSAGVLWLDLDDDLSMGCSIRLRPDGPHQLSAATGNRLI